MPRFCSACGRSLDEHEVIGSTSIITRRGRGRVGFQRVKQRVCDVRLIARDWKQGRIVPESAQRTSDNDARYVHSSRLQPGGDLA